MEELFIIEILTLLPKVVKMRNQIFPILDHPEKDLELVKLGDSSHTRNAKPECITLDAAIVMPTMKILLLILQNFRLINPSNLMLCLEMKLLSLL